MIMMTKNRKWMRAKTDALPASLISSDKTEWMAILAWARRVIEREQVRRSSAWDKEATEEEKQIEEEDNDDDGDVSVVMARVRKGSQLDEVCLNGGKRKRKRKRRRRRRRRRRNTERRSSRKIRNRDLLFLFDFILSSSNSSLSFVDDDGQTNGIRKCLCLLFLLD